MADITIIMPSYNKEEYISEALDSVFMQETSYDYHIVVADDCSADKTVDIVKQYQEKYPDKITLLTSETNQKLYKNVLRAYEITKTDYFCVLDPDDYWIDKYKIQKALDFLENNKDYTIYVTDTAMLMADETQKDWIKHNKIIDSSFEDFLNNNATLGCTLGSTFRNVVFKNGIPDKMKNLECETMERSFRGDTFRSALHLYYGKAHYVPETDAVYRVTTEGLWQGISELEQDLFNANIFKDLWIYFDKKYDELLLHSYRLFNKVNTNLLDNMLKIQDKEKRKYIFNQLENLKVLYNENQQLLNCNLNKNLKLNYRIMLYFYNKLHKKLSKKGLI